MSKTVILGAARTPIGKMGGGLSTLDATELGGLAISAALERSGVEPEQVDHVVMGQVLQAGQGQIPSRRYLRNESLAGLFRIAEGWSTWTSSLLCRRSVIACMQSVKPD